MEYNNTQKAFIDYINKCREKIRRSFFTKNDADSLNIVGNDTEIDQIIKKHRLKMIDIKLDHTMRMVEQVIKINQNLGINVDLDTIIKVSILYHDIGRMRQSTWSNTFADSVYKRMNQPFNNHGEDGYDIFLKNDFGIDEKYVPVISETILHHQDVHTQPKLQYRYDYDLSKINIDDIITGRFRLNDAEWQVASLIVQLVADIDKTDILYQHLWLFVK